MNHYAVSLLQEMKETKLAVIILCGNTSTGKSFLANRLLNKSVGFEMSTSSVPCTKGIVMWSKPV